MPDLPPGRVRAFEDDHCASCLAPLPSDVPGLYCGTLCKEVAGFVRYVRSARRGNRLTDPDVAYAASIKLAHLYAGGYDAAAHAIPASVRAAVVSRDGGRCVQCGAPGEEIDHVGGPSPALDNLQLLCRECHRAKTAQSLRASTPEDEAARDRLFAVRVDPPIPLLLADDDEAWATKERALRAERRRRLKNPSRAPSIGFGA